ncbi:MAG: hypothetical protein HQL93_13290 [Magnetococcales bacterium]|nr:hypothetical protein [Magnetococcales bacterium]
MNLSKMFFCSLFGLLTATMAHAENITMPYTFTSGTPIKSSEVNNNFSTVYDQVNRLSNLLTIDQSSGKLSVAGTVESTTGGFKFPDGSVQTTAAPTIQFQGGSNYLRIGNLQIAWGGTVVTSAGIAADRLHVRSFSFTFPAAFSAVPTVTNRIDTSSNGEAYANYKSTVTTTTYSGSVLEVDNVYDTNSVTIEYIAIGPWN